MEVYMLVCIIFSDVSNFKCMYVCVCVCPQPFSRHIPMPDWLQENLKSADHSRILDHLVTNVWIGTADDYFHLLYTYMILYEMFVCVYKN